MDLLQSPACLLDGSGNVIHLNNAWRVEIGLTKGTDEHTPWTQLFHPEDRYSAIACLRSATTAGCGTNFEGRLRNADGADRWFMFRLQSMSEASGDACSWLCFGVDIHELKCRRIELERREAIQADMPDVSVDCIKLITLDGTLVHVNKAGCRALGVSVDSGFGMPWLPLLPQDVWPAGEKALASARAGTFARFPGRSVLPGQKVQQWDNMLTPIIGASGQPTAILCVSREVTAEHEALEALRQSEERLAIAARVGGLGIWDYDVGRDDLRCDEAWYRIMGRDPASPIRSIAEFHQWIHPADADKATEVEQTAAEFIAMNRDYSIVYRIIWPGGETRWVRSAACLVADDMGEIIRAVGFVMDITDERHAELELRESNRALEKEKSSLARQSLEDPLTGIANRRHLDSELARVCSRAAETGEVICIGMADVDHFKAYNDRYGHLKGDSALCKIASALQSVARQSDLVARYGGEEFAFVLIGVADPSPVLARLAAAVANLAIEHEDSPTGYLTISCGCVVFGSCEELSPRLLLKEGDEALYAAKFAGRNQYVIRAYTAGDGGARVAFI